MYNPFFQTIPTFDETMGEIISNRISETKNVSTSTSTSTSTNTNEFSNPFSHSYMALGKCAVRFRQVVPLTRHLYDTDEMDAFFVIDSSNQIMSYSFGPKLRVIVFEKKGYVFNEEENYCYLLESLNFQSFLASYSNLEFATGNRANSFYAGYTRGPETCELIQSNVSIVTVSDPNNMDNPVISTWRSEYIMSDRHGVRCEIKINVVVAVKFSTYIQKNLTSNSLDELKLWNTMTSIPEMCQEKSVKNTYCQDFYGCEYSDFF